MNQAEDKMTPENGAPTPVHLARQHLSPTETDLQLLTEKVTDLLERGQTAPVREILADLFPQDIGRLLNRLEYEHALFVFNLLEIDDASLAVEEINPGLRREILATLNSEQLVPLLEAMPADDAADVVGQLTPEESARVLRLMDRADAEAVRRLLRYPESSAGGIMNPELVRLDEEATVSQAIDYLRHHQLDDRVFEIFIADREGRFLGTVPLNRLVVSPGERRLVEIVNRDAVTVHVLEDQEEVARKAKKYDLVSIPVVDNERVLLGRVTIDDIVDIIVEEATEDVFKLAGTDDEELSRRSTLGVVSLRLPWLLIALGGTMISALLIRLMGQKLPHGEALVLASFIPAIPAMGGNAGLQTSTLTIRGLATGFINPGAMVRTVLREVRIAFCLGVVCGAMAGFLSFILYHRGEIGLIVGGALFLAILVAAFGGAVLPLLLKRLKLDPAIASGPLITMVNDILGIAVYLAFALIILHWHGGPG